METIIVLRCLLYSVYPNMECNTIRIKYWTKIITFGCTRISMSKICGYLKESKV